MQNILILGATSSIARSIATIFAARGDQLYLASRDTEELARITNDLKIRYNVPVHYSKFDAEDSSTHLDFWQNTLKTMQHIDGVIVAFGYLGNADALHNTTMATQIIQNNFAGAVSILNHCANYFEAQKHGFIIGLSSVAGDRGRQSNYIYGAAKAALATYLQGLRNRLYPAGIQVITIKLGFVDTAMTYGLPGLFLVASPEKAAQKIIKTIGSKQDIAYIPGFWRYIMLIIKTIPEGIFKRLKI